MSARSRKALAAVTDLYAETIPHCDPAEAEKVSALLNAMLPRLQDSKIHALIADEKAIATVSFALRTFARHPHVARLGSVILRSVCGSEEGRAVACAHGVGRLDVRAATFMGLLHAAVVHRDSEETVASALEALACLVEDSATEALLFVSEPRCLTIIADLLWRHAGSDRPEAARHALHILANCDALIAFYKQLAGAGFIELAISLLGKHMDVLSIVHDTAAVLHQVFAVAPPPASKAAELVALLMSVVRRYDHADGAIAGADAPVAVPTSVMVVQSALRAMARLALAVPVAGEHLVAGSGAFQLVGCMRRHMGSAAVAVDSCELIYSLAVDSPPCASALILAGAVPLLVTMLEAHEVDERVVATGGRAFSAFARDAASRWQVADEAHVRLLLRLLRRHIGNADAVYGLVAASLAAVVREESGRAACMDGGAAPETLRLLLEVVRIHKGSFAEGRSLVGSTFGVLATLCRGHSDIVAAHAAGVAAAALAALQDVASGCEDERAVILICAMLTGVTRYHVTRSEMFAAGAPAVLLAVLKRCGGSDMVARGVCGAFREFAEDKKQMAGYRALMSDAAPLLLAAVSDHMVHAGIVANAVTCVARMQSAGPPSVAAAAIAAVPVLLLAVRTHPEDEHVASSAWPLLYSLAIGPSPAGARALTEAKAVPDAVAALQKHGDAPVIAAAACGVLVGVSADRCPGGVAQLTSVIEAVLPAAARALRHRVTDDAGKQCVMNASGVLCKLASDPSNLSHFARGIAIPALLGLLKRYADSGEGETADTDALVDYASVAAMALSLVTLSDACAALMRTLKAQEVAAAVVARMDKAKDKPMLNLRAAAANILSALTAAAAAP